jgi:periplasmic divalent cation tolerance protein
MWFVVAAVSGRRRRSEIGATIRGAETTATASWGGPVTDKVVIMVTAATKAECRKIARHLVEMKLAACVNITQPIESIYRWKGKVTEDKEYQLIIKSTRELLPEIKAAVSYLHSYHLPEIICLPIIDGSRNYLQWVGDSVKTAAHAEDDEPERGTAARDQS